MPQSMSDVTSVAANSTVANVLAGKLHEFLSRPSILTFAVVGAAAGLFATVVVGSEIVVQDQEISAANRFPVLPDDILVSSVPGVAGERVLVSLRNSTAGAIIGRTLVRIDELA